MRVLSAALTLSGVLLASGPIFASTHSQHRTSAHRVVAHAINTSKRRTLSRVAAHSERSTQSVHRFSGVTMTWERATEIQSALIKAGYLNGEPTGSWDSESQSAMQKLQADHGWQTKLVPDSRALIQLGLGPGSNHPTSEIGTSLIPMNQ